MRACSCSLEKHKAESFLRNPHVRKRVETQTAADSNSPWVLASLEKGAEPKHAPCSFGVHIAQVAFDSLERGAEPKHAPGSFGVQTAQVALGSLEKGAQPKTLSLTVLSIIYSPSTLAHRFIGEKHRPL